VLFWLPTAAREQHLHRVLDEVDVRVAVATAARDSLELGACAADPIWLVHGSADPPARLVDLACLGDRADAEALADVPTGAGSVDAGGRTMGVDPLSSSAGLWSVCSCSRVLPRGGGC